MNKEIEPWVMSIVRLGQKRFSQDISHEQMIEQAAAKGSWLEKMVQDLDGEQSLATIQFIAKYAVNRRFELVEDAFDVEEALIVCTALMVAMEKPGGWYVIIPGQTFVRNIMSVAIPYARNPELQDSLIRQVAGTVTQIKKVATEYECQEILGWCDEFLD